MLLTGVEIESYRNDRKLNQIQNVERVSKPLIKHNTKLFQEALEKLQKIDTKTFINNYNNLQQSPGDLLN